MNKFEKLVELIVNEDNKKARKLFHKIVVEHSRTIYEGMIDDEDLNEAGDDIEEVEAEVEADEEGLKETVTVSEAKALLDFMDGTLKESAAPRLMKKMCNHYQVTMENLRMALEDDGDELLDVAYGGEGGEEMSDVDDMAGDIGGEEDMDFDDSGEMGDHEMDHMDNEIGDEDMEDRVVDLEDAIDELKAEFDQLIGDDGIGEDDFGAEDETDEVEDDFGAEEDGAAEDETDEVEESIVREYVEKVSAPSNSEAEGTYKQSNVAKPNRMGGGTSANILGKTADEKGNLKTETPKDHPGAGKFQNDPKAKAGKTGMKTKVKQPAKKESGTDKKSLLGGPKGKGRK